MINMIVAIWQSPEVSDTIINKNLLQAGDCNDDRSSLSVRCWGRHCVIVVDQTRWVDIVVLGLDQMLNWKKFVLVSQFNTQCGHIYFFPADEKSMYVSYTESMTWDKGSETTPGSRSILVKDDLVRKRWSLLKPPMLPFCHITPL